MTILSTICLLALGAAPVLEKTDLFAAGGDEYAIFRIPGIVVTAKGTLLAYCEGRRSGAADWGAIDIVMRRSVDAGKSWSDLIVLGKLDGAVAKNPLAPKSEFSQPEDITYNNPVMMVDRDSGRVHLLYCVEYFRCFHAISDDDGMTFSKPVEITKTFDAFRPEYDWKVLATGPGHGIQLKSGRFVVPVWLSLGTGQNAHHPSVTATIVSDDGGKTWQRGDVAVRDSGNADPGEASAVELAKGEIMLIVRSHDTRHRKLVVVGPDGASGWSKPAPRDDLVEPICQGSVCRWNWPGAEGTPGRLLYSSPDNLEPRPGKIAKPGDGRDRKNLSIKMSTDDGKSWPLGKTLEPGASGYSDLAVFPNGRILCFYERWNVPGYENRGYHLTLASFNREWLEGGKPQGASAGVDVFGDPLPEGAMARFGAMRFRHDDAFSALVYSRDGKRLVAHAKSEIIVWDAATGQELRRMKAEMPDKPLLPYLGSGMDISPDSNILAIAEILSRGMDTVIGLWDLTSGKKIGTLSLPEGEAQYQCFDDLQFSADGKSLAVGQTYFGQAVLFDVPSRKVRTVFGDREKESMSSIALAPDGKTAALTIYTPAILNPKNRSHPVPFNASVALIDLATGKRIRDMYRGSFAAGGSRHIQNTQFSPDGKILALRHLFQVHFLDVATGKEWQRPPHNDGFHFDRDGHKLVIVETENDSRKVVEWNPVSGERSRSFDNPGGRMARAPDGETVAFGGYSRQTIPIWSLKTGKRLFTNLKGHDHAVEALVISPDRKTLISSDNHQDGGIIWDLKSGRAIGEFPKGLELWKFAGDGRMQPFCRQSLFFSPDGSRIGASVVGIPEVRIVNARTGKSELTIEIPDANGVASSSFSADGRTIHALVWRHTNGGFAFSVRHYRAATGELEQSWPLPGDRGMAMLAPDGKTVMTTTEEDVRLFDAPSGRESSVPDIGSLGFSPDSKLLASIDNSMSTITIWEAASRKAVVSLPGHRDGVIEIAWSPDGSLLAAADSFRNDRGEPFDSSIRLWDIASGTQVACFEGFNSVPTMMSFSSDSSRLVAGLRDGSLLAFDTAKYHPASAPPPVMSKGDLESLWADLLGDAPRAHRAIWAFARSPRQSMSFLQSRLKPIVVANAAAMNTLIADLNSGTFAAREAATKQLHALGEQAEPGMRAALKGDTPLEARRRLSQILDAPPSPATLRMWRAIAVLERIGNAEAVDLLATLAKGAAAVRTTDDAAAALARVRARTVK